MWPLPFQSTYEWLSSFLPLYLTVSDSLSNEEDPIWSIIEETEFVFLEILFYLSWTTSSSCTVILLSLSYNFKLLERGLLSDLKFGIGSSLIFLNGSREIVCRVLFFCPLVFRLYFSTSWNSLTLVCRETDRLWVLVCCCNEVTDVWSFPSDCSKSFWEWLDWIIDLYLWKYASYNDCKVLIELILPRGYVLISPIIETINSFSSFSTSILLLLFKNLSLCIY